MRNEVSYISPAQGKGREKRRTNRRAPALRIRDAEGRKRRDGIEHQIHLIVIVIIIIQL